MIERTGIVENGRATLALHGHHVGADLVLSDPAVNAELRAKVSALKLQLAAAHREIARLRWAQSVQQADRRSFGESAVVPIDSIMEAAAEATQVSVDQILRRSKHWSVSLPRQFTCWLIKAARPDLGCIRIGRAMKRNPDTVRHALEHVERDKDIEPFAGWRRHPAIEALTRFSDLEGA